VTSQQGQSDFSDALQQGNHQGAGEWLVRSFAPEVFGLCLAIVQDRAHAEDLSQEVFASAFAGLSGYRGEASARTWLLKIARNRCIDHLRKHRRWSSAEDNEDPDGVAEEVSLPNTVLSRRSDIELALHELEEVERALIVLRFSHGMDYDELAIAFGLKAGTARMRVSRALAKMRDFLSSPRGLADASTEDALLAPRSAPAGYAPEADAPRTTSRSRTAPMPAPMQSSEAPEGGAADRQSQDANPPARQAPSAPPPAAAPGQARPPAPGSFSAPPSPPPPARAGAGPGHVLQTYFASEESWLSINLQVRLRDMAEQLPAS
jgi:RNA polymerase sigma-70 factor (ECF subfamily)